MSRRIGLAMRIDDQSHQVDVSIRRLISKSSGGPTVDHLAYLVAAGF